LILLWHNICGLLTTKNPNHEISFFSYPSPIFSCVTTDFDIEANDLIDDVNVTANEASEQTADYRVSFVFDWNKTDFPTDYPSTAHFSPLVGWVHEKDHTYFNEGQLASKGIEQMAETGSTSTLVSELQALIDDNEGLSTYTGSGINSGVGTITIDITVNLDFPAVSLASMLAPSPDWFVACINVNLLDEDGSFVIEKTVVGHVYDAGTEEGDTFSFNNDESCPQEPIRQIVEMPLGNGTFVKESLCTVVFTKL